MHSYIPTDRGAELAQDTGLDRLADNIYELDELSPLLNMLSVAVPLDDRNFINGRAAELARDVAVPYCALSTDDLIVINRGLGIDPEQDTWQYFDERVDGTLFDDFPYWTTKDIIPATTRDQFVLSGLAGYELLRYRNHYPLLARSRYEQYGFRTFSESCAFVGAYVVGSVFDKGRLELEQLADEPDPYMTLSDGDIRHRITVSADAHGDLQIGEAFYATSRIISPRGMPVEFSPLETKWLQAYHSVEPMLAEAMITYEFLHKSRAHALLLIDQLEAMFIESDTEEPDIKRYGDYGSNVSMLSLSVLRNALADDELKGRYLQEDGMFDTSVSPQSLVLLAIRGGEKGMQLFNTVDGRTDASERIQIPSSHYGEFFRILLLQAARGLGRTSPSQHLDVIYEARKLLVG